VAVAILVTASSPVPAATGPGTAILLKPGTRLDGKDWAYIYRRDIPAGTLIPLPRSFGASQAVLSPDGSVVAFSRMPNPGVFWGSPQAHEVAVTDTAGREMASFTGAVRLAWSPSGARLAIGIGCD